jgi:hypothetical protein
VCSHRINFQEYISYMQQGLVDLPDIQVSTFQTFTYLASYHGSSLLEILNSLPDLLMKHVMAHLKAVRHSVDCCSLRILADARSLPSPQIKAKEPDQQSLDCLRAFLRALLAFNKIPGHEQSQKCALCPFRRFVLTNVVLACRADTHFFKQIMATPQLAALMKESDN